MSDGLHVMHAPRLDTVVPEPPFSPETGAGAAGVGNRRVADRRLGLGRVNEKYRRERDRGGDLADQREFTHGGGLALVGRHGV